MSTQAKKLYDKLLFQETEGKSYDLQAIGWINQALTAAKAEGIAEGEEKKRVEVHKEAAKILYTPDNIISSMESLQPLAQVSPLCIRCNGVGIVKPAADDCPACGGTGIAPKVSSLAVELAKDILDTYNIGFRVGQGESTGIYQDLVITINDALLREKGPPVLERPEPFVDAAPNFSGGPINAPQCVPTPKVAAWVEAAAKEISNMGIHASTWRNKAAIISRHVPKKGLMR